MVTPGGEASRIESVRLFGLEPASVVVVAAVAGAVVAVVPLLAAADGLELEPPQAASTSVPASEHTMSRAAKCLRPK